MNTHGEGAASGEGEPGEGERGADPMGCPGARRAGARGHASCQEAAAEECLRHHVVRLGVPSLSTVSNRKRTGTLSTHPFQFPALQMQKQQRRGGGLCHVHYIFTAETQQPSKGEAPVTYLAIPSQRYYCH